MALKTQTKKVKITTKACDKENYPDLFYFENMDKEKFAKKSEKMVKEFENNLESQPEPHVCHIKIANLENQPYDLSTEFVFVKGKVPLWWLLRPVF